MESGLEQGCISDDLDDLMLMESSDFSSFFSSGPASYPFVEGNNNLDLDLFPNDFLADQGYSSSSNCSESGKFSPNGSDSNGEGSSAWPFPSLQEPLMQDPHVDNNQGQYAQFSSDFQAQGAYSPCTSVQTPNSYPSYASPTDSTSSYYSCEPNGHHNNEKDSEKRNFVYVLPSAKTNDASNSNGKIRLARPITLVNANHNATSPILIASSNGQAMNVKPITIIRGPAPVISQSHTSTASARLQPITVAQVVPKASDQDMEQLEAQYQQRQKERRYKNRVYAQISRTKKKEEIDEMKRQVNILSHENKMLRDENSRLKARLLQYEPVEVTQQQVGYTPSPRKRAAVAGSFILAMVMFASFSPMSLDPTKSLSHSTGQVSKVAHGRILGSDVNRTSSSSIESMLRNISAPPVLCTVKSGINATESIRIMNDLYEWVDRHEQMNLMMKGGKRVLLQKRQKQWAASNKMERITISEETERDKEQKRPKKTLSEAARQKAIRSWKHLDMISQGGEVLPSTYTGKEFVPSKEDFERLATTIQQRSDTLYVVTMKDYFLLPAIERNMTSRPRLTLILPALSNNSTSSPQIALMRIDLNVVGTGLFNLPRKLLPLFNY